MLKIKSRIICTALPDNVLKTFSQKRALLADLEIK